MKRDCKLIIQVKRIFTWISYKSVDNGSWDISLDLVVNCGRYFHVVPAALTLVYNQVADMGGILPVFYLDPDRGRGRLGHSVGQSRPLGWSPDIRNIRHAGEQ